MAGVPELMILRLLAEREMYGYELARAIRVLSDDTLSLGEGVLYPALHVLEARRMLRSRKTHVDGRLRVYYTLSRTGRSRLDALTREWLRIRTCLDTILGRPDHG
jgi:PadR family transcriptional regulator PadR